MDTCNIRKEPKNMENSEIRELIGNKELRAKVKKIYRELKNTVPKRKTNIQNIVYFKYEVMRYFEMRANQLRELLVEYMLVSLYMLISIILMATINNSSKFAIAVAVAIGYAFVFIIYKVLDSLRVSRIGIESGIMVFVYIVISVLFKICNVGVISTLEIIAFTNAQTRYIILVLLSVFCISMLEFAVRMLMMRGYEFIYESIAESNYVKHIKIGTLSNNNAMFKKGNAVVFSHDMHKGYIVFNDDFSIEVYGKNMKLIKEFIIVDPRSNLWKRKNAVDCIHLNGVKITKNTYENYL